MDATEQATENETEARDLIAKNNPGEISRVLHH
jgi:hypothetical protein